MDHGIDVAECLRRWRGGDEEAAAEIVRHLYPVIVRIVRTHRTRRESDEDLTQEILMKVFARLPQYRAEVPLTHWVSRLAVTTCLDRLRAQKARPEIHAADLSPEEGAMFDAVAWESRTPDAGRAIQARDLVEKLLALLPAEDRSLILMIDLEGKSLDEIADLTGWGKSKIKMRLFRARGLLRQTLQRWDNRS